MTNLLHPELIQSVPLRGPEIQKRLDNYAAEALRAPEVASVPVTVAVRTLNEADCLESLLQDVAAQTYSGEVEVVVVDNESTDHTRDVARAYGASVVNLTREDFTYPRSMNLAMEAASHDLVYLTVGHALMSTRASLRGGLNVFANHQTAGGVFGHVLPSRNASGIERAATATVLGLMKPQAIKKAGFGALAAIGAMIKKDLWDYMGGFDERYQSGGEDTAFAAKLLSEGFSVHDEPLLWVHHSHGLGPVNSVKQLRHWLKTLKGPVELDMNQLKRRRPDRNWD